jgi:hypothetical protein
MNPAAAVILAFLKRERSSPGAVLQAEDAPETPSLTNDQRPLTERLVAADDQRPATDNRSYSPMTFTITRLSRWPSNSA